MNSTKVPEGQKGEVTNLTDAANRILHNKARIKAKTQDFAGKIKLQQLAAKRNNQQ